MRAHLVFICLMAATFALSVKSKPHGKYHALFKTSHTAKEKDVIPEENNKGQVLPTFVTFEASSQEQGDEEMISEDNANANTKKEEGVFEVTDRTDKSTAVLLSEEELVDLLKKEAEEEEGEQEEEMEEGNLEIEENTKETRDEEEEKEESKQDAEVLEKEDKVVLEEISLKAKAEESISTKGGRGEKEVEVEETDGSTESEIPVDLDYAADSGISQALLPVSAEIKPPTDKTQLLSKTDVSDVNEKEMLTSEKIIPTIADDYEQDMQNTEPADSEEVDDQDELPEGKNDKDKGKKEAKADVELEGSRLAGKEGAGEDEKTKNDSASHSKGKTRKQKKNQRARKHPPQKDETRPEQEESQPEESEDSSIDNAVHKAKRRRAGKWAPLVGMNPVQIRATVDLYPSARPTLGGGIHHPEAPADPCDNFRCKRGKTCKLDADNKPACVCQEPSECPPSVNEFDHVCGTDNNTYDTSCELFATKCNLEGTKRGHRLHLDYTGPCKFIAPCLDTELVQFPLRMRDWLKNVLLQLYEHDSMSPGFLTSKQRARVRKIFESERRLHAGDHSIELLAQDFEKNYNMYIYPVHWQFAQMDQHPSDRFLSHSELAPLRVPLVPMEHCTSRFFQECDADKDKQVSFKEWAYCFGIKDEDMDVNLLF
ncbi:SPARC-like protein 1 [Myripristis murdjan]|uniref:SPARC-like protein 1 n=1 Tax=Myripristis murdjan TaxID=586833 RepID=UPI001176486A|nr:SPARC-like protein 1 [Myripristis murdjan]